VADDRKAPDEPFLQRWARRKAVAAAPVADPAPPDIETASLDNAPPVPARPGDEGEASGIDLSTLPDIDSLDATSDFSVFMQDGIPDALRTRALNRLWRLDPSFGHVDGLLDYGEDFTGTGLVAEAVNTVYKVGKGMLSGEEDDAEVDADVAAAGDAAAPALPAEGESAADMPAEDDSDIPDKAG
jgi:Protein of unknown function (DUF3306)